MSRLNKQREDQLQPKRMEYSIAELQKRGIQITFKDKTTIRFLFKGNTIEFYPYSGWHQGKGINPGRGIHHLLKQLNETP